MSYQATFVDAATSLDPVNRENTFISYYTYGHVLALGLDLSLRGLDDSKNLDDFMKLVWQKFGKHEIPFRLADLQLLLCQYTDEKFSDHYFTHYIYQGELPDFKELLAKVGISFDKKRTKQPYLGAQLVQSQNKWKIASNPIKGSALYNGGLTKGDLIISVDGKLTNTSFSPASFINSYRAGDKVKLVFKRFGKLYKRTILLGENPAIKTALLENQHADQKRRLKAWLGH